MTVGVMRYTVVVRHPETHEATALVVGKRVPDWATDLVHADDVEPDGAEKPKPAKKAVPSKTAKPE